MAFDLSSSNVLFSPSSLVLIDGRLTPIRISLLVSISSSQDSHDFLQILTHRCRILAHCDSLRLQPIHCNTVRLLTHSPTFLLLSYTFQSLSLRVYEFFYLYTIVISFLSVSLFFHSCVGSYWQRTLIIWKLELFPFSSDWVSEKVCTFDVGICSMFHKHKYAVVVSFTSCNMLLHVKAKL